MPKLSAGRAVPIVPAEAPRVIVSPYPLEFLAPRPQHLAVLSWKSAQTLPDDVPTAIAVTAEEVPKSMAGRFVPMDPGVVPRVVVSP